MVLNTDTNVKIKEIKNKILNKNNFETNKKNENKNNIKNKFNKHNNTQTVLRNVNKNKKETFSKLEKSENSKIQKSASKINKSTRNFSTRPEKIIKPLSPIRPLKKSTKNIITEKNITNTENNIAKSEKKVLKQKTIFVIQKRILMQMIISLHQKKRQKPVLILKHILQWICQNQPR